MKKTDIKRSRKSGLAPGSLVHLGDRVLDKPVLTASFFNQDKLSTGVISSLARYQVPDWQSSNRWLHLAGVHDTALLSELGERFAIHPLTLEDILNTGQRPKMDLFDSYLFLVLRLIDFDPKTRELDSEQISLVLGSDTVISLQEGKKTELFSALRRRLADETSRLRTRGVDYLFCALLDSIVDHYFAAVEGMSDQIAELEERLLVDSDADTVREIHRLKRAVLEFRRQAAPLRVVLQKFSRGESGFIREETRIFFTDVYDHVVQIMESLDSCHEILSGLHDIYLSSVSNRMNQVMKVLTIIATIFIPLTFIAGIYGMNFQYMPELGWKWGYPLSILLMAGVAGLMIFYFRKKKWF